MARRKIWTKDFRCARLFSSCNKLVRG